MPEEQPQPQAPVQPIIIQTAAPAPGTETQITGIPVEKKKQLHAGFWSFNELFIVKQLSTVLHVLSQIAGTGYLLYYIYETKIYLLVLVLPILWIAIRFIFEILVVPFVISYDLDKVLRKLTENDDE